MVEGSDENGFEAILDLLIAKGVEFVVVGGQAEVLHGSARTTYDVDLCYRRTTENLEALAAVLLELGVSLRDAPPELSFHIDARALALGSNFTFSTSLLPLDLLAWLPPVGGYDEIAKSAEAYQYKGRSIQVIGLDDLIQIKEYLNRPKDREALLHLRAIRSAREK